MSISIHIEAATADEARDTLRALLGPAPTPAADKGEPDIVEPPKPATRRRKAAQEPEQPVTDIDTNGNPVETADEPAREVVVEDVRNAAKRVAKEKGEDACLALLKEFGSSKVSDVFAKGLGAKFIERAAEIAP